MGDPAKKKQSKLPVPKQVRMIMVRRPEISGECVSLKGPNQTEMNNPRELPYMADRQTIRLSAWQTNRNRYWVSPVPLLHTNS